MKRCCREGDRGNAGGQGVTAIVASTTEIWSLAVVEVAIDERRERPPGLYPFLSFVLSLVGFWHVVR